MKYLIFLLSFCFGILIYQKIKDPTKQIFYSWSEPDKEAIIYAYKSGCLEAAELPIAECEMRSEEFYQETYGPN